MHASPAPPTSDERFYQIALTAVPGVGDVLIRQLLSYCGSASAVFGQSPGQLQRVPGIGKGISSALRHPDAQREAERAMKRLDALNATCYFYTDANYPARLKSLYDAPAMLYQIGGADLNPTRTLAIVGTRQATEYGRKITEEIVAALAPLDVTIVSGLAYGIDIAAHRASLQHGLPTLGVMASGLDIIYPSAHQRTAQEMLNNGALLTENRPGTKPDAHLFPARNRIIAGLSDATLVVEAASKGGALLTAEYANNYHRDVFAVPGALGQTFSQGCHRLIRENKAQIYTSPADLIDALNWNVVPGQQSGSLKSPQPTPADRLPLNLTTEESQMLALLRGHDSRHIDELSFHSQLTMSRLASLLLSLEFQGFIKTLPGKRYALV